ncbi:uncharacterized protein LOC144105222 isoform X2 [Amblyomma americanum]
MRTIQGMLTAIMQDFLRFQFTTVEQFLFVKRQTRSWVLAPWTRCEAMMKLRQLSFSTFEYAIYNFNGEAANQMEAFVSTLSTFTTRGHVQPNAVSYRRVKGGEVKPFQVMYADLFGGCFILVTAGASLRRGCRLLQTYSTVNLSIPPDCRRVYRENCPRDSIEIYNPACQQLLSRFLRANT